MVLEPLGAFAVACNVVQIVEVGIKIAVGAADRIRDGSELSAEHRELRDVSRTINNLSSSLEVQLVDVSDTAKLSQNERRLAQANKECFQISRDFINMLARLRVKDRPAVLESFKMSIKAYWFRDRIEAMQKALSQARDNLNFAFMLYMNSQQMASAKKTQDWIQGSNDELEEKIMSAIESSSGQMRAEIRKVAEELKDAYLDSDDPALSTFLTSNRGTIESLTKKVELICLSRQEDRDEALQLQESLAQRKILDSLQFPDIYQRLEHIAHAHRKTYEWMMRPLQGQETRWTCFNSWLRALENPQRVYWIQGKPGSGKSTLLKFLDGNLDADAHMDPWADGLAVYRARFFFWNPGSSLQKSLGGLYRTILFELLGQRPDLISTLVNVNRWRTACLTGVQPFLWINSDLHSLLQRTLSALCESAKVFLLIDGLDELEGSIEEQEQLLDFLTGLGQMKNLKLCISSRPWNVFRDALSQTPQLRLEDLTSKDIETTVISTFERSSRWTTICAKYPNETNSLVTDIVDKASGVFLWVRLVMQDLLRGVRDGDNLPQLKRKLVLLPEDLNDLFKRMIESIEPQYRGEASKMLQLACHEETQFETLHHLRLLELSFVDEQVAEFATASDFDFSAIKFNDPDHLKFRIDSTLRKLNSRCLGLLECSLRCIGAGSRWRKIIASAEEVDVYCVEGILDLRIDFIHRSLKEFLTSPQTLTYLHFYTTGPLDKRRFLSNARLVEFMALSASEATLQAAIGCASYLLSALSVERTSEYSATMFTIMQANLKRLAESGVAEQEEAGWYIQSSLLHWSKECSNLITLAIDFGLSTYVMTNLTRSIIKEKEGRPILDYILRPRFLKVQGMECGNRWPDIEILRAALALGADPNEQCDHIATIWESFLWLWYKHFHLDSLSGISIDCRVAFTEALKLMLRAGARPVIEARIPLLNHHWALFSTYGGYDEDQTTSHPGFAVSNQDTILRSADSSGVQLYPVSRILTSHKRFRDLQLDTFMDELKAIEHKYIQENALVEQHVA